MAAKCPGMNIANWKTSDINDVPCRQCGEPIEFWKDDVKLECMACGAANFNPNLGNICLSWCNKASECIGNQDIDEWKKKHAGNAP